MEAALTDESIRPWGQYQILYDGDDCKVKRITVNPGGKLSYQYHFKRNEDWLIISGHGVVTLDGIKSSISPGHRIHIATKIPHRVHNTGSEPLVFIEIQTGSYFGEDDIVRIEDDYGRN
jgi:mannose-6-phosphate isomerase-like protein (cupin superfamily)